MASDRSRGETLIDNAIREGKISASHRKQFLEEFDRDPDGMQRFIAKVPASPFARPGDSKQAGSTTPSADHAMDAMYNKLTNPTAHPGPRNVIADHGAHIGEPPVTESTTTTYAQMNAQINADPELQRMAWALGVRDGINKPQERYEVFPKASHPGTYRLVEHNDGSGHWEMNQWPELQ